VKRVAQKGLVIAPQSDGKVGKCLNPTRALNNLKLATFRANLQMAAF
jgi:hypothetical protein